MITSRDDDAAARLTGTVHLVLTIDILEEDEALMFARSYPPTVVPKPTGVPLLRNSNSDPCLSADNAEFDVDIQVDCSRGYLLAQFLSLTTNY